MSAKRYDALVIGGGIGGLVAATYLARGGLRTLLLEARNKLGGRCETLSFGDGFSAPAVTHTLTGLDPRVVKELRLARDGLKFPQRDMPLVGLRRDGKHIVLSRDLHATRRSIAAHSESDAARWPEFRKDLFSAARAMRSLWWEDEAQPEDREALLDDLRRSGVSAWLDSHFESAALKAPLAVDAMTCGLSPCDAGSALVPLWRAAQEMCGLQGAVAFPAGGPASVAGVLERAARTAGVDIRTGATVEALILDGDAVSGVRLSSGETIGAPVVLAALPRRRVLLDLAPTGAGGFALAASLDRPSAIATGKVLLGLNAAPSLPHPTGRFVIAERIESLAAAHATARAERMPDELVLEIIVPSAIETGFAPPGQHVLSVLVHPLPTLDAARWDAMREALSARVIATLKAVMPDVERHIVASEILAPSDIEARYGAGDMTPDITHMLAPWRARLATPIRGLYLCGRDAEPVPGASGRAARIAAALALRERAS